jgi:hypothetical protein
MAVAALPPLRSPCLRKWDRIGLSLHLEAGQSIWLTRADVAVGSNATRSSQPKDPPCPLYIRKRPALISGFHVEAAQKRSWPILKDAAICDAMQ